METPAMSTTSVEDALRSEVLNLQSAIRRVRETAANAVSTIGAELMAEADNRGWCSEYDRFVERLNDTLPDEYQLPVRVSDRTVHLTYSVTIEVTVEDVAVDADLSEIAERAREIAERGSNDGFSHLQGSIEDVTHEDSEVRD